MLGLTAAGTWGANILIWLVSGLCIACVMGNNMTDRHVWKVCRSKELEEKHKVFITLCSPTMKTIGPQKEWLGTYRFNPPLNIYIYHIYYIIYQRPDVMPWFQESQQHGHKRQERDMQLSHVWQWFDMRLGVLKR